MSTKIIGRRGRRFGRAALCVALLAVAGCATTAQECDPRKVSDAFTALSCDVSGGFSAHLQAARDEVAAVRQQLATTQRQTAAARNTANSLAAQRGSLDRQLSNERTQNDRARLQLSSMRVTNDRQKAQVAALNEQLAIAERNLASMQKSGADDAQIARLAAENEEIRQTIKIMTQRAKQE